MRPDSDVLGELVEKAITVFDDRAEQLHCPENSTDVRMSRGNHAARGLTYTDFLVFGEQIVEHLDAFHEQVTAGEFPGDTATSRMDPEERDAYLGESTED